MIPIVKARFAPTNLHAIWIDTSVTPNVIKLYSNSYWQTIGGTDGDIEGLANHIANNSNPHKVTKSQVGLNNVTNDSQVKRSEMGKANGVATLDSEGKVPSNQLPSFVDDVVEY
jgi:hypothetical protein